VNEIADRAAAAGIVWVNASGNEAERHTVAAARDADGDGEFESREETSGSTSPTFPPGSDSTFVLLWETSGQR